MSNLQRERIQRYTRELTHADRCNEPQCAQPFCEQMKSVLTHTKICLLKLSGRCLVCKKLTTYCWHHAQNCNDTECLVPFCSDMKHKFKLQKLFHRVNLEELLRRRHTQRVVQAGRQYQNVKNMILRAQMNALPLIKANSSRRVNTARQQQVVLSFTIAFESYF